MRTLSSVLVLAGLAAHGAAKIEVSLDMSAAQYAAQPEFLQTLPGAKREALEAVHAQFQAEIRHHGNILQQMHQQGRSKDERIAFAIEDKQALYARLKSRTFQALSPIEAEGLRRFAMRQSGPRILRLPEVGRRFNLSKAQQAAIGKRVENLDRQMYLLFHEPRDQMIREANAAIKAGKRHGRAEMDEMSRRSQDNHRAAIPKGKAMAGAEEAKILRILTASQRDQWARATRF